MLSRIYVQQQKQQLRTIRCGIRTPIIQHAYKQMYTTNQQPPKIKEEEPSKELRTAPKVLGLRQTPVVNRDGWLERKKNKLRDLTDYDKAFQAHAAERRHLVEEATKSYFADAHEMRKHGGKMYHAADKLIKADKAGYMPDFEGINLDKKPVHTTDLLAGKISLMSFVYAKYGETHVNSFVEPLLQHFKDNSKVQLVEVNVQENLLKQWLLKAFVPSIRKNLPEERKQNYTLLLKDISRVRKHLDMTNQHIGYVYIIDEQCKIRWTAHGDATKEEIGNMLGMLEYLSSNNNNNKKVASS
ncbi:ATPase assembly factor ATP10 [Circinella umbellata]|nr:ATPase assembly factor ATP10 [Circinella umbellata]